MWPLSWYQFCVSLLLEVRTVGLVLFLQILIVLFVLHCLPTAGHVEGQRLQCSHASQQQWTIQQREESVVCYLCRRCPPLQSTWSVSGNRCHTSPLPLSPTDRTSITSRHCEKCAEKATSIEMRREEWAEEDQSDRRFFMIDFHPILPALQTPCRQPGELDFYRFSSDLLPRCVPLTDSCFTFPLVLPQPKTHSLSASSMQDPSVITEEVWHIHLHSGQHRHHAADGDLAAPCRWRGQDRRLGSAWVLCPLLLPLCTGGPAQKVGASPSS